jgi:hypothetical protein
LGRRRNGGHVGQTAGTLGRRRDGGHGEIAARVS